ncbi:MAG: hypothetical protein HUU57_02675 [Bdellovibrio sp.]|nr:hypothetical protein [Bdellovibrio sp.]
MDTCKKEEVALKGLFLGPQAENQNWVLEQVETLLKAWFQWRQNFRPGDGIAISDQDMLQPEYILRRQTTEAVLLELSKRFENEIPKFSPRYIGHMFSEVSLPALFGHILTLLHNPNNISAESSLVGTQVEDEAIAALSLMMGLEQGVGHFTSGGTVANFEAVYRALARCYDWMAAGLEDGSSSAFASSLMGWHRYQMLPADLKERSACLNPTATNPFVASASISAKTERTFLGPILLVPQHKHYSWVKAAHVFGLGAEAFWSVKLNSHGHLDVMDLRKKIELAQEQDRPIAMIVSVLGTTELGMIDPIDEVAQVVAELKEKHDWHLWHHVDAAYGGFLCSLQGDDSEVCDVLSPVSLAAVKAVRFATSVTIDPHKLGYVPYACGAFIAAAGQDYYQRSFGGPYVNFSQGYDKGLFTLEGSRSATGAVATWMTARCVGLGQQGYGRIIARTIRLRKELEQRLCSEIPEVRVAPFGDANLLGFCLAANGDSVQEVNKRTLSIYESFSGSADTDFFVSKTYLYKKSYSQYVDSFVQSWQGSNDCEGLVLIRLCIMNPFFRSIEMKNDFLTLFVNALKQRVTGDPKGHQGSEIFMNY